MDFFEKIKKLERKHMHELTLMCGGVALLLLVATFVGSGIPRTAYAWIIYVYPVSYTPVTVGGNTTISWHAPTSDVCSLRGPTLPCINFGGFTHSTPICQQSVNGPDGSITTGPINGPTTYTILCQNVNNGGGGGQGSNSITVTPTIPATTLTSFTASPSSLGSNGGTTVLSWTGTQGANFSSCLLSGGQWGTTGVYVGGGLPNHTSTSLITTNTTYTVKCYDTTYGWVGPLSTTVSVAAPTISADATSNSPRTVGQTATISFYADSATPPTKCQINDSTDTVGLYSVDGCSSSQARTYTTPPFTTIGTYSYFFYYLRSGVWTKSKTVSVTVTPAPCANGLNVSAYPSCTCPSGQTQSGGICVATPQLPPAPLCANGLANSYAPSCTCPSGQVQSGSLCVSVPTCANGLASSYAPSCTCPSGQVQSGSACILSGVINSLTVNPSRVLQGRTSTISWSTSRMSTCSLQALAASATTVVSSALSSSVVVTINSKTDYTLSCTDATGGHYTSSVSVSMIPQTIEQ